MRFGKKFEALKEMPGTTVYLELGKAPRFSKQITRRLESYGLWGTAVNRFEETGAEAGGSFGPHVYWRASATGGTPLYFRDPNALAGDNGTPERTVGSTTPVVYGSGIPILYDTMATDVNFSGRFQLGGGVGLRFNWGENRRDGVDLLGWYFRRDLAEYVPLRGTFYSGDLAVLEGYDIPLPFHGTEKYEYGVNLEARFGPVHLFGQGVKQSIAGLEREGYEVEASVRIALPGLFASGDQSVVNWIEPAVRVSYIDNLFDLPAGFVAPSFGWDWRKYDFGFRLGIVRGLDLTVEYARNDVDDAEGRPPPGRGAPDAPRGVLDSAQERLREEAEADQPDAHRPEPHEPVARQRGDGSERDRHLEERDRVREAVVLVQEVVRLLRLRVPLVLFLLGFLLDLGLLVLVALLLLRVLRRGLLARREPRRGRGLLHRGLQPLRLVVGPLVRCLRLQARRLRLQHERLVHGGARAQGGDRRADREERRRQRDPLEEGAALFSISSWIASCSFSVSTSGPSGI